eukprot:11674985-Alexandrium_andersonii.AAC.1
MEVKVARAREVQRVARRPTSAPPLASRAAPDAQRPTHTVVPGRMLLPEIAECMVTRSWTSRRQFGVLSASG